jgi:uncharacterized membrane protein
MLTAFIVVTVMLSLPVIRFHIVPKRTLHGRAHIVAMQQFCHRAVRAGATFPTRRTQSE